MLGIEKKVANTAKRAGLLSGGLLLCAIGIGFLTVAGWFALAPLVGAQNTALIFGGIYAGVGLIMVGAGVHRSSPNLDRNAVHAAKVTPTAPPIVEAFMYGLQAGAGADRSRRS